MHISEKHAGEDWAARVNKLVYAQQDHLSAKEIFESDEMRNLLIRKAEILVSGCCEYLRNLGFNVDKRTENGIISHLQVQNVFDTGKDAPTAYSTSDSKQTLIFVNAGNELVQSYQERSEQFYATLGFFYHELGHVLFTSFPTLRAFMQQTARGKWFPGPPDNIGTIDGINLQMEIDKHDDDFLNCFTQAAKSVANSLEDGYIEGEMVEMYPGICKMALNTINTQLLAKMEPLSKQLDVPEPHVFSAMMSQILRYAKFSEIDWGDESKVDDTVKYALEDCLGTIDAVRVERDPNKRFAGVNNMLVTLFPFLDKEIKQELQNQQKQGQQNQQSQGQQNGQQGSNSSSGAGAGAGSGGSGSQGASGAGSMSDAVRQIMDRLAQAASAAGIGNATDQTEDNTTDGIANVAARANQGKKLPNQQQGGNLKGGQSNSEGASSGTPDESPAKREFDRLLKQVATDNAQEEAENERTREMNKDVSDMNLGKEFNVRDTVKVVRAPRVSDENKRSYNRNASYFEHTAADLTRSLMQILKDRREGGRRKNLVMGRRFEANHWCVHDDFKDFSKVKWPTESPTLSFGLLVDESGSTDGPLIAAASKAAIVLELFADKKRGLDIKHVICGYTTGGYSSCEIRSYSEPNKIDGDDVYRITGMNASGGTPTAAAMCYMRSRLNRINTDLKLMIVISDGGSGDNEKYPDGSTKIKRIINTCRKEHTIVIAAGIGQDRDAVKEEFGNDHFLDISDLEEMPEQLADIIKDNLWV